MTELVNLVFGLWGFAVLGLSNTDVEPLKQQALENRHDRGRLSDRRAP